MPCKGTSTDATDALVCWHSPFPFAPQHLWLLGIELGGMRFRGEARLAGLRIGGAPAQRARSAIDGGARGVCWREATAGSGRALWPFCSSILMKQACKCLHKLPRHACTAHFWCRTLSCSLINLVLATFCGCG